MKLELSPAAEIAIERARTDSVFEELDLLKLLQHLLQDEESHPSAIITHAGGQIDGIRTALALLPPKLSYIRKVLGHAREIATDQGESVITGEYLLHAILTFAPELRQIVESTGADMSRFLTKEVLPVLQTLNDREHTAPLTPPAAVAQRPEPNGVIERICDVNANRVRESLRILDDYARFAGNQPYLTRQLKNLRHDFVSMIKDYPELVQIEYRNTVGDVGTTISTANELSRTTLADVAIVNCKRLQESLRSLEEFSKLSNPTASQRLEQLRYRSYTLEREISVPNTRAHQLEAAQLYFLLSDRGTTFGWKDTAKAAIAGGVQVIQLREKTWTDRQLLPIALELRQLTQDANVLFIINDRPDLAALVAADGVHLGQDDLPAQAARRILPPDTVVGVSTHQTADIVAAINAGADYIGIGPTFPSRTKEFPRFAGIAYIREAMAMATLPAFAIGGITLTNVHQVLDAGCQRIAVSSEISLASQPEAVARTFRRLLERQSS